MTSTQGDGLWAPSRLALTEGLVLTITFVATEALAVITVLPIVARHLGGLQLYGWVFSAFMLGSIVGIVGAGPFLTSAASSCSRPAWPSPGWPRPWPSWWSAVRSRASGPARCPRSRTSSSAAPWPDGCGRG